jgi:dihydrodipicolinate synthase/N-acetylneuraminate lyase
MIGYLHDASVTWMRDLPAGHLLLALMEEAMANAVDERLATVERSLARWRLLSVAAIGLAVMSIAAAMMGRTSHEIRAHALSLVDQDGVEVAHLGDNGQGGPLLKLHVPRTAATYC